MNDIKNNEISQDNIPKDWEIKTLGELCTSISDGTHHTPQYVQNGVPFYSVENVAANDFRNSKLISYDAHFKLLQRCKPEKGDILLTRIGTLGKTKIIDWDIEASIYVSLALLKIKKEYDNKYIYSYTKSDEFVKGVVKNSLTNAVPQKINMKDINNVQVVMPTNKKEQQKITSALSDMDNLIESLEKIIEKKKKIKRGIMQQLLTCKKRLPGFNDEWKTVKFGETLDGIYDYTANGSFQSLKDNVTYYSKSNYAVIVRTADLNKRKFSPERFTDKKGYDFLSKTSLNGGEIVMASVGSLGNVYKIPYYNQPMTLGPNCYLLEFNKLVVKEYIYYFMKTTVFNELLSEQVGSSTLKSLNKDNLRNIEVYLPLNTKEQQAIASILANMDDEIKLLEEKLAKYKKIEEGMMQELLTGRIRLI